MTSLIQIQKNKDKIKEFASHFHATNIRVFGSVARGENNEKSDIDFLVSFLPGASLIDQFELTKKLSDFFNCPVDVVSDKALNKYFSNSVLNEAVKL